MMRALHTQARLPARLPMAGGLLQRKCACGSHSTHGVACDACRQKAQAQRRSAGTRADTREEQVPSSVHDVLRAPGAGLDPAARAFFESRFGEDFSAVRVHTDPAAQRSARAVDALAYTVGSHIVFGRGAYAPGTGTGDTLLAHELAHVVQQGGTSQATRGLTVAPAEGPAEAEADRAAADVLSHRHVSSMQPAPATVAREKAPAAKTCPATHTMPDDVYKAVGEAWKKSGHGGDTVHEQGGRIVTDKSGKRVIRTGGGGSGSISLPDEEAGDTTVGTFHTHPYSKSEGSTPGVGLSGGDIKNFVDGAQGTVKYIGAGTCNFALDTLDAKARDDCKKEDLEKRWDDAFAKATGDFQGKVETAVKATIAGCGLCYYKACRPDDKSPIPKTGNLV